MTAPGTNTECQVLEVVADLLAELDRGHAPVALTPASQLERDLGIYSLERVELLLRLEEAFGVPVSEDAGVSAVTVADLVRAVGGAAETTHPHALDLDAGETSPAGPAPRGGSLAFTAYLGLMVGVVATVVWPLLQVLRRERAARLLRGGARIVLRASGCRSRVEGLQHLGGIGPAVLVANHESYVDSVVLLATLPIDPNILVNERLPGAPLIGTCVRAAGYVCVDRTSPATRLPCADALVRALQYGQSVLVFPEATFPDESGLLPFRLGAFAAAAATGLPVVPITLRGTREMLPPRAKLLRRVPVSVTIHPPLYPAHGGWADALRLRNTARNVIADSIGRAACSGRPHADQGHGPR